MLLAVKGVVTLLLIPEAPNKMFPFKTSLVVPK